MLGQYDFDYFWFVLIFSFITVLIAILTYLARTYSHRKRMRNQKEDILSLLSTPKENEGQSGYPEYIVSINSLLSRRLHYIENYILFQAIGKTSDGLSLWFSVSTLVLATTSENTWKSTVISVLAIAFVIVSIYVAPMKRAKQYLNAWRRCDRSVGQLLAMNKAKEIVVEDKKMTLDEFIPFCAKSLADAEDSITTDED